MPGAQCHSMFSAPIALIPMLDARGVNVYLCLFVHACVFSSVLARQDAIAINGSSAIASTLLVLHSFRYCDCIVRIATGNTTNILRVLIVIASFCHCVLRLSVVILVTPYGL